jgi:hypothetical protein
MAGENNFSRWFSAELQTGSMEIIMLLIGG